MSAARHQPTTGATCCCRIVASKIQEARMWLEERQRDRRVRGVQFKDKP